MVVQAVLDVAGSEAAAAKEKAERKKAARKKAEEGGEEGEGDEQEEEEELVEGVEQVTLAQRMPDPLDLAYCTSKLEGFRSILAKFQEGQECVPPAAAHF
jgi:hypothetical protein